MQAPGFQLVQPTALRERPRVAPTACDPTRRPAPEGATNKCYALALAVGGAARVNESPCTAGFGSAVNFRVKAWMRLRCASGPKDDALATGPSGTRVREAHGLITLTKR